MVKPSPNVQPKSRASSLSLAAQRLGSSPRGRRAKRACRPVQRWGWPPIFAVAPHELAPPKSTVVRSYSRLLEVATLDLLPPMSLRCGWGGMPGLIDNHVALLAGFDDVILQLFTAPRQDHDEHT